MVLRNGIVVGTVLPVTPIAGTVKRVTVLGTRRRVKFEQTGTRVRLLNLPAKAPDPVVTVFKIECEGPLKIPSNPWPDYLTGLKSRKVAVRS